MRHLPLALMLYYHIAQEVIATSLIAHPAPLLALNRLAQVAFPAH
jgi:hypothetical protein